MHSGPFRDFPSCADVGRKLECCWSVSKDKPILRIRCSTFGTFANRLTLRKVADNRATIRQRLVGFLTPEQLTKWDAEAAKAKEFLGQKLAA
jgi:hypothetical protein